MYSGELSIARESAQTGRVFLQSNPKGCSNRYFCWFRIIWSSDRWETTSIMCINSLTLEIQLKFFESYVLCTRTLGPIDIIFLGLFSQNSAFFSWLPVSRSVKYKVYHVYQLIGSGIQLEFFESYVPFSGIFAPSAGCSEKIPPR